MTKRKSRIEKVVKLNDTMTTRALLRDAISNNRGGKVALEATSHLPKNMFLRVAHTMTHGAKDEDVRLSLQCDQSGAIKTITLTLGEWNACWKMTADEALAMQKG